MNIVFIMSDTFRRDHLGCYGNKTIRTPHLDQFAKRCIVFDKYYANSFPTVPSRADIFTGKWTYTYLGWTPLPQKETVLAQVLQKAGYATKAVVDTPFLHRDGYGYDRGFIDFEYIRGQGDYYGILWEDERERKQRTASKLPPMRGHSADERHDVNLHRRHETDYCAPATMLAAERWLQRHYKEDFFLYIDTWDPHEPWDPPRWYVEPYYPEYDGKTVSPCYGLWRERGLTQEDLNIAHACYCGEVTMVDRWVGRLLDTIESLNLMDKTIVIFTTDHGYYFGEHGQFGKGMRDLTYTWYRSPIYEETAHIPLLAYVPGLKPRRVDDLVSTADLMPTILELAGADIPGTVQSQSLVPLLRGEKQPGREFVVTSWPLYNAGEITKAVDGFERWVKEPLPSTISTRDEWTLIYSAEGQPAELYQLSSDPKQENNLISKKPEKAQELLNNFVSQLVEAKTEPRLLNPRRRF